MAIHFFTEGHSFEGITAAIFCLLAFAFAIINDAGRS
jgi:hypothetical protein